MQKVTIAIDQTLAARHGPEICWAWRFLLTGMGFAWEEVDPSERTPDISYTTDRHAAGQSRLCVIADERLWASRGEHRLRAVRSHGGLTHPVYDGDGRPGAPWASSDGTLVCARDIVFDVFWLATGQEERHWPMNEHGHFDLTGTPAEEREVLRGALASGIGAWLERALADLGHGGAIPRWPNGRSAAACASHDVDYPEVVRWLEPLRVLRRLGASGLRKAAGVGAGRRHHWHFASWMRTEQDFDLRSAFYFVPRQGSLREYLGGTPDPLYDIRSNRFRDLFARLADDGTEIGLHASYRACESLDAFAREKELLEAASGQPVRGNRHHYWHLRPGDPEETLAMHEALGLRYDASLNHERYPGYRRGSAWPFFPFHQGRRREIRTLQIPTAWMDDQLFGHFENGSEEDRYDVLRAIIDTTQHQQGCLLVDIHDYVYDDALYPGWARTYRWLWEQLAARTDFWFATPAQVAEHWTGRQAMIEEGSEGLLCPRATR